MSLKDEYIAKMNLQLDELTVAIKELEVKAHEAKDDAQATYREGLNKLHLQSILMMDKLDELKAAGDNTWDNLVAETEKVRDAFIHSYHYFKSHF